MALSEASSGLVYCVQTAAALVKLLLFALVITLPILASSYLFLSNNGDVWPAHICSCQIMTMCG